ncbi:MAG: hypothetical protein AB1782_11635 [Cyanobacteriota bacterium]
MPESDFMIITGNCCSLAGSGIVPSNIYSYYKTDNLLVYDSVEYYNRKKYLIYSSEPDIFDNILLFSTILKLDKGSETLRQRYSTFVNKVQNSFLNNIFQSSNVDFANQQNANRLSFFYEENKKIFKTFNRFKLLAINLSDSKFTHSGFKSSSLAVWFIKKMEEYDITNYELCELTYSKRSGLFS